MFLMSAQISDVKNLVYWCGELVTTDLKQRGNDRDEHIRVKVNLDIFLSSANGVEMTRVWSNAQRERLTNAKHEDNNKNDRTLQGLHYNTWRE